MKKIIYTLTLILLGASILIAQSNFHNTHYLDPYNPEYVKGEVLIKFKDETQINKSIKSGVAKTGITSIDILLEPYQIETIDKVFKETREQRQRKTVKTIRDFKGNEIEVPALFNIYKLKFDTIWDAKQIIEELQKDPNVEFAEPNYLVYSSEVMENGIIPDSPPVYTPLPSTTGDRDTEPNDPLYQDGSQWYLDAIDAPAAWDSVTGDTTQIIAIIDTGVDWDHPDLDDNIWTNWNEIPDNGIDDDNNGYIDDTRGWDYINNDNDPNDDNSHGTHVAGIAAAEGNNGIGICGVAWNAHIMPIKMLQSSGSGNSSDLASAIEYASDNGATVINMSLGSYGESGTVKNILYNAYVNSLLVAAAGNDGFCLCNDCDRCTTMFPAGWAHVLGVRCEGGFSNIDPSGPIEFTHPDGFNYELMAPGVGIISAIPNGNYRTYNGTSMAAPIVSGICALSKSFNDTLFSDFLWAKLIFGSDNNFVNAYNTLTLDLDAIGPDLRFIEYTLIDTLPGCDNDGRADAGETIQIYFTVKNVGGYADSVWSKIRFGEFEDTTVAVINDSTSYIGDISTWATLTSELSPIEITIDSSLENDRDIVFEFIIGNKTTNTIINFNEILETENGVELSGVLDTLLVLDHSRLWLVMQSFRIDDSGELVLKPGTILKIKGGLYIDVRGKLFIEGNKDSLVTITSTHGISNGLYFNNSSGDTIKFCHLHNLNHGFLGGGTGIFVENCVFEDIYGGGILYGIGTIRNSIVRFCNSNFMCQWSTIDTACFNNFYSNIQRFDAAIRNKIFQHNNFIYNTGAITFDESLTNFKNNNIISYDNFIRTTGNSIGQVTFHDQYWGTTISSKIDNIIYDFYEDPVLPMVNYNPYLDIPSDSAHGIVWKIELNDINPFDETLDPIGSETVKFDVYFNRAMDTLYPPLVGFGVAEPFLQRIISDSAQWSSDSTIWTAYYTIGPETGDGINTVHVRNARDPEGFEIPPEKYRFKFVIQAASAASIQFFATPGIGIVELEWPPTPSEDALGYNLYRSYNLTDSTYSDTLLINTDLILDTVYTDYNVIPDTTYHYLYKTLGTDMVETDYSKKVTATPFDAANGDANGDIEVNVLDITTIVSYMLNQNPSPFLFDAADVNYDNEINVLDIIGLVQLINGKKSLSIKPLPEFSKQTAYYSIKDDKLLFESKRNVRALQFKIMESGVRSQESGQTTTKLDKFKIFSLLEGFEFSYGIVDDEIIGILYSMSGKEIPHGLTELFRFEGISSSDIEITEIFGGDLSGNYVPVLKKGENASIIANEAGLQVNPNPFSNFTQINYLVPENGIVNLKLFDLTGAKVKSLTNSYHQSGNHTINWDGTNSRGQLLKQGIYLLQIKVESVSGNNYNKEVKVVFTR